MPCIHIPNGILTLAGDYQPGDMRPNGYMEREEWAAVQMKAGLRQVACGRCGEWKFPQELSGKYHRTAAINRRGETVKLIDPRCYMPALPAPNICKTCTGSGTEYKEPCGDCDGEGEFEHGSHTYDCKRCDGAGKVQLILHDGVGAPCEDCGGTGHDKSQIASVGSSTYMRNLLEKIVSLPGARIQVHANGCHAARFIFDGGEGVVMPCRV